ncbi:phosphatase PAP2 family protein [Sinimarinibacterium sp. CAU 1509]|uniref:phosphatase PAP2 family protein n=1 Tax=Sinimarinibacterium sp. CAU 1509 TaxID=2562283 RepID=UPI0010AC501C|nr:phosphatase PAP2 family protein [Sinimarinibacterium sp. CAU 1509]TJY61020.1 phosphatase PAP2 family protein [Sinimarinibacterium sp. CAU 1509]
MARTIPAAVVVALLCFHAVPAQAISEELPADIVTGVLPLASLAVAYFKDDGEGTKQFLRSTGVSLVLNTSLRVVFNQTSWGERPNGHPYGFPSGHVGFATSSAAFLQDRYGWKFGLPAYAAVGYIAYVRVDTDHHRWRDVIAGAAVSYGVSKLFVTPEHASHLAPVIGPDFLGMRWERSF